MLEVSLNEGSISSSISASKTIPKGYQRLSKGPSGLDEHAFAAESDKYRSTASTSDDAGDMLTGRKMSSRLSIQATAKSSRSLGTGSIDRTPRPSISHTCGLDDEDCQDEACRSRARLQAIDDGWRRRLLPTDIYTLDRHRAYSSSTCAFTEASVSNAGSMTWGSASNTDFDWGCEFDTDVELDSIALDDIPQSTFEFDRVRSLYDPTSKPRLMTMVPLPHNSVKIGTSSTPQSFFRMLAL